MPWNSRVECFSTTLKFQLSSSKHKTAEKKRRKNNKKLLTTDGKSTFLFTDPRECCNVLDDHHKQSGIAAAVGVRRCHDCDPRLIWVFYCTAAALRRVAVTAEIPSVWTVDELLDCWAWRLNTSMLTNLLQYCLLWRFPHLVNSASYSQHDMSERWRPLPAILSRIPGAFSLRFPGYPENMEIITTKNENIWFYPSVALTHLRHSTQTIGRQLQYPPKRVLSTRCKWISPSPSYSYVIAKMPIFFFKLYPRLLISSTFIRAAVIIVRVPPCSGSISNLLCTIIIVRLLMLFQRGAPITSVAFRTGNAAVERHVMRNMNSARSFPCIWTLRRAKKIRKMRLQCRTALF